MTTKVENQALSAAIFASIDGHFGPVKPDEWVGETIVSLMICLSVHLHGISEPAQADARAAVAEFFHRPAEEPSLH